ncbi:MAG TPA: SMC-Scp complex subunit ScpB [Patescibacteria group bacterium]|nr:SMC-Scp complex subunit ScpB [Patescibacteria group bacterium]
MSENIANLKSKIESVFFISPKPLSLKKLVEITGAKKSDIQSALEELTRDASGEERGIRIIQQGNNFQMTTNGDNRELVEQFIKDELTGELTKPALETLTIVAYRGPITKIELELIRGVNCSLILRNLLMRGLVQSKEDSKILQTTFEVTIQFLKYLGISGVQELPDYEKLNRNQDIAKLIELGSKQMIEE